LLIKKYILIKNNTNCYIIIISGSRITTIFNFGYVSLNIMHLRAEDSGEYTLRAINRWGEIISTSTLNVIG